MGLTVRGLLLVLVLQGCPKPDPVETGEAADADGDGHPSRADGGDDCDDTDAEVYPGAPERCDHTDQDCDGLVDEEAADAPTWYTDDDGDGHGDATRPVVACDPPDGATANGTDCDDADATARPGAPEDCDGADDDCDGRIDEGTTVACADDADGDGYGDLSTLAETCACGAGQTPDTTDCDDADPAVFPGAPEVCDGRDQDCDGAEDDGVASTWHVDRDGDGWGDPSFPFEGCTAPLGYVDDATDCDDMDARIHPGAEETCSGHDDDCDGVVDEPDAADAPPWYLDADGDGWGTLLLGTSCDAPPDAAAVDGDCDDADTGTFPGAPEACDGEDQDCDGAVDEGVTSTYWRDLDGDGAGDPGAPVEACALPPDASMDATDCDDTDPAVHPGAPETCDDRDEDCDGLADVPVPADAPTWYGDADMDGFGTDREVLEACDPPARTSAEAGDCDDTRSDRNPAVPETCDGEDDDCDGDVDESDAVDARTWFPDTDSDGYGNGSVPVAACWQPSGTVPDDTDCNDHDASHYPGADERCDGADDDCDGLWDEPDAVDAPTWYLDADGDGWGNPLVHVLACEAPSGTVADGTDCDDTSRFTHPGAEELCDGVDTDCNGIADDPTALGAPTWYADADGDGFGDAAAATPACTQPSGFLVDATDCDDTDPDVHPDSNATEVPLDGIDTDCDGLDACTDLTCDGLTDLVLPVHYDGDYLTSSWLYPYDGAAFSDLDRTEIPTDGPLDAAAADLDGDGYLDLVMGNCTNGTTTAVGADIWWGGPGGISPSRVTTLPSNCTRDVLLEDLDLDGHVDVVLATSASDTSSTPDSYLYWGSPTGPSATSVTRLPSGGAYAVLAEDLDGDAFPDLVFGACYDGDWVTSAWVYDGATLHTATPTSTKLDTNCVHRIAAGDLDGDGWPELAFPGHYDGTTYTTSSYVYRGGSGGYSTSARTVLPSHAALDVAIGDVSGDGYEDVVFGGYYAGAWTSPAYTRVYCGSPTGISTTPCMTLTTTGTYEIDLADLDGDGDLDLACAGHYGGTSYSATSRLFVNDGTGLADTRVVSLPSTGAIGVVARDLDGNGTAEIVLGGWANGAWTTKVPSLVYHGAAGTWSSTDVDTLSASGVWNTPLLVGPIR